MKNKTRLNVNLTPDLRADLDDFNHRWGTTDQRAVREFIASNLTIAHYEEGGATITINTPDGKSILLDEAANSRYRR